MADELDQILGNQPPAPEAEKRTSPLTLEERLLVQNFYDTDTRKRRAFMKKLGFELNPKDDNQYRPAGSLDGYAEIDPGISAYFKKGGLAEIGKDIGDVAWDFGVETPVVSGLAKGAAALAGPLSPVKIIAGILGGATGKVATETVKHHIANAMLDESIPADKVGIAAQALIVGSAPQLFKLGAKGAKAGYEMYLKKATDGIVNAFKTAGNNVSQTILTKAAKDGWTKDAVKGANEALLAMRKKIFGQSVDSETFDLVVPERMKRGSLFFDKLSPLNDAAKAEIETLTKNPQADFTLGELLDPIRARIMKLTDDFGHQLDPEKQAALKFLREQEKFLLEQGKKAHELRFGPETGAAKAPIEQFRLTFGQARQYLDNVQDFVFSKDSTGNYVNKGANYLSTTLGGGADQVLGILNAKAKQFGSKLPEINAQRSAIIHTYNNARKVLTNQNITNAFLDEVETPAKLETQAAVKAMDEVLGTNITKDIEDGSAKAAVERMFSGNQKAFGFGRVGPEMAAGFAKGAVAGMGAGAGLGALTGVGVVPGTIAGAVVGGMTGAARAGTLAAPERALEKLAANATKLETGQLVSPLTKAALTAGGSLAAIEATNAVAPEVVDKLGIPEANASVAPKKDELDEILGL